MYKCIESIKNLINIQVRMNRICLIGEKYTEFQKTYFWTNEWIDEALHSVNLNGKDSALAVTSSGDHAFNLVTNGIMNIDTFDSNRFTEYFAFGLKRAMILKYDYKDFYIIINLLRNPEIDLDELNEIIYGLLPFMEHHHQIFWQEILNYNYNLQKQYGTHLNLILMLTLEKSLNDHVYMLCNGYLKSEKSYEKLRNSLSSANITFTYSNAVDLSRNFSQKYDILLLSNILDYLYKQWGIDWNYEKLKNFEQDLSSLMNDNGIIFLHYVMAYYEGDKRYRKGIINNSSVSKLDFEDEELLLLPQSFEFNSAIVLKRIKRL